MVTTKRRKSTKLKRPFTSWEGCTSSTSPLKTQIVSIISRRRSHSTHLGEADTAKEIGVNLSYQNDSTFRLTFSNNMIPIVMGAPKEDYLAMLPPNSYINVDDFKTIKELTDYINYLDKNDTAYASYFAWKEHGRILVSLSLKVNLNVVCLYITTSGFVCFPGIQATGLPPLWNCVSTP